MSADQRKRQRVPISCLVCKRRKVKCDKVKPVCGVCVKNGVPHLCGYLDPHWSKEVKQEVTLVHKTSEQGNKTIQAQRKEIDDLRRRLALMQQESNQDDISKSSASEANSTSRLTAPSASSKPPSVPMTVLQRLTPTKQQSVVVEDDLMNTVTSNQHKEFIDVYSWLNLLKVDLQLSNLWFKIINLQKIYSLHRSNSMKKISNGQADPSQGQAAIPSTPRCPVMQIDLTLLASHSPLPITNNITFKQEPSTHEEYTETQKYHDLADKGLKVLNQIQALWRATICSSRDIKMNYERVHFLLNYYFDSKNRKLETKDIMIFYKDVLLDLVVPGDNDDARLNKEVLKSNNDNSSAGLFFKLKSKAIYLCMISLIIEETLTVFRDSLRRQQKIEVLMQNNERVPDYLKNQDDDDAEESNYVDKFRELFPNEVSMLALGDKGTRVQTLVQEFLTTTVLYKLESDNMDTDIIQRIPYFACCILLLSHSISNYNRGIVASMSNNWSVSFSSVFPIFVRNILTPESLALWVDPKLITIPNSSAKRIQDLQTHMCALWKETIRIINLVSFSLVPLTYVSEPIGDFVLQILDKIDDSERHQFHTDFIKRTSTALSTSTSFSSGFLIARIYNTCSRAINGVRIDTDLLNRLSIECGVWIAKDSINDLKGIEEQAMLHYLRFFLAFLIMIQEETQRPEDHDNKIVRVLTRFCSLIEFVRDLTARVKDNHIYHNYILSMITELMSRMVPIISAVLLRLGDAVSSEDAQKKFNNVMEQHFPEEAKTDDTSVIILSITNSTIAKLGETVAFRDERVTLLSKVWNFYVVFIKNIHKINYSNYAKIHANVPIFNANIKGGNCPVRNEPELTSSVLLKPSDAAPSGKCPVDHTAMTKKGIQISVLEGDGKCPVDYRALGRGIPTAHGGATCPFDGMTGGDKKRKCPFDHDLLSKAAATNSRVNAKESNIRGGGYLGDRSGTETPPASSTSRSTTPTLSTIPAFSNFTRPDVDLNGQAKIGNRIQFGDETSALSKADEDLLPGILNDFAELDFELGLDFNMFQEIQANESIDRLFQ